jgi:hypothetical protein
MSYSRGHGWKMHRMRTALGEEELKTAVSETQSSGLGKEQTPPSNKLMLRGV